MASNDARKAEAYARKKARIVELKRARRRRGCADCGGPKEYEKSRCPSCLMRRAVAAHFREHLTLGFRLRPCINPDCQMVSRWCYCSQACRSEDQARAMWNGAQRGRIKRCTICSVAWCAIRGFGKRSTCSDACSAELAAQIKCRGRRKDKAKRKALSRGISDAIAIDPFVIFERDRWHCQGCGCWTPKDLRGTYHHNAPELDHKLPIAKGGKHVERNLQLLCRTCNRLKSDMYWNDFRRKYL